MTTTCVTPDGFALGAARLQFVACTKHVEGKWDGGNGLDRRDEGGIGMGCGWECERAVGGLWAGWRRERGKA